jgi:hypothetical protein
MIMRVDRVPQGRSLRGVAAGMSAISGEWWPDAGG